MKEIENFVEVRVTGPLEQQKIYMDWIMQSGEYVYSAGIDTDVEDPNFFLMPSIHNHYFWRFSSSNLKRKVRLYKRFSLDNFKYRVNYIVYYGKHRLTQEDKFHLDETNYPNAIYTELVRLFNPFPTFIAKKCPDLIVTKEWGSYYIAKDQPRASFQENDFI